MILNKLIINNKCPLTILLCSGYMFNEMSLWLIRGRGAGALSETPRFDRKFCINLEHSKNIGQKPYFLVKALNNV